MFTCFSYILTLTVSNLPMEKIWFENGKHHHIYLSNDVTNSHYTVRNSRYSVTYWMKCEEENNENK